MKKEKRPENISKDHVVSRSEISKQSQNEKEKLSSMINGEANLTSSKTRDNADHVQSREGAIVNKRYDDLA